MYDQKYRVAHFYLQIYQYHLAKLMNPDES